MSWQESEARTYPRHLPLVPVEASGVRVRDRDGRWYVDCLAGAGALSLGHGHPVVHEAIARFLASGAPLLTLDFPTPVRDAFYDEVVASLPAELADRAVIHPCAPSGANAVEAALTVAEWATGGFEHVAIEGGFHGCTRGARSVSSGGGLRDGLRHPSPPAHFLPFPQQYRCPFGVGGERGVELAIRAVDRLFRDPHSGLTSPASVLAEFVLGEGGSLPAPPAWMAALRDAARGAGIPLVADEVQSGAGRTGTMWAFEHGDVVPDIVVMSKGIGGGLPLAVIVMREELNAWPPGAFIGTFRGNALAFAAGAAVLRFIREQDLAGHAAMTGRRLAALLAETQDGTSLIGEVRGRGLMLGAEIVDPLSAPDLRGVLRPAPDLARLVQRRCFDQGLIVEVGGAYDNVVRFLPPLVIEEAEVDTVGEMFDAAVREVEREALVDAGAA